MKNLAIARCYAKALLLIGKEDGNTEIYRRELDDFADLVAREDELRTVISNPIYHYDGRRTVLQKVIGKLEISRVMESFLLLLFAKGRIGFLDSIADFYQKLADDLRGVARASLVSASELSSETIDKIRQALAKKTGKEIILTVDQDKALIGGIMTRIGDLVLDGSVKTQLLNMRESLKRGESV